MNNFSKVLTALSLTALIASQGFAATTTPQDAKDATPSAAAGVSPAPGATSAPAPAPHSGYPSPQNATPMRRSTLAPAAPAPAAAPASTPAPAAASAPASAAQVKLGYIDMSKVAEESASGKAAAESIKSRSEKLKAKIEAKENQLKKQKDAIEAKIHSMSNAERTAKTKEFQKKVEEYQKLVRSSESEMQKMQEKFTTDLYNIIKKAAGNYARANGYAAIVEEKGLLFTAETLESKDLTEEIAAFLDKQKK